MYRKNIIVSLFLMAFFAVGTTAIFAQTQPFRGRVMLKKADGTTVPVGEALIEGYRTDSGKGKLPSTKTDKKGYFSFAGLRLGETYVLVVSGAGIKPEFYPNVKGGMADITIDVSEGDGKVYTEDEVRKALTGASTQTTASTGELTAEQKKQKAEYDKQVAEVTAKNKKIEQSTAIVKASLEEGTKAYSAKNYDLAIVKFDEGYNADPEFAGSAPVLLNNKSLALKNRAVDKYNLIPKDAAPAARIEALKPVKEDLMNMVASSDKVLDVLKTATTTDAAIQKGYDQNKYSAMSNRVEAYRLMFRTKADTSKSKEAVAALQEYEAVEKDPAVKAKVQLALADAIRESGDSENSIPVYRRVLEAAPDNPDATAGLGLSLFNAGVVASANGQTAEGKTQMQEGLNMMQKFADSAPDTHPLKASVKEAVDYLKTQEKLTPQKTTGKPAATKKRT